MTSGTLYVVATPIGNLEDVTLRALRVLKEVSLIAAEDTRRTRKLLTHYGISTPTLSYFEHKEEKTAQRLLRRLLEGESIAVVSDAGSPSISDPGYRLVRAAKLRGLRVVPVPGPSAPVALLTASGLPTDRFVFDGFLPRRGEARRKQLQKIRDEERTVIFFESPERIRDALQDIAAILGEREIAVGREITKLYEEVLLGTASQMLARLGERDLKGEVTIAISGRRTEPAQDLESLASQVGQLRKKGMGSKKIAELLSERTGARKKTIYNLAVNASTEE